MSLTYQVYLQVLIYYFMYKNLTILCVHFFPPSLHAIFIMIFNFINILNPTIHCYFCSNSQMSFKDN